MGLFLAGAALLVGVVRMLIYMIGGGRVGLDGFPLGALFYAAGFAVAGTVVGLLSPMRRHFLGRFVLGFLGAAIASTFITRGMEGPISQWGRDDIEVLIVMAVVFGLPLGWQLGKEL